MHRPPWFLLAIATGAIAIVSCAGEVTYLDRPGDDQGEQTGPVGQAGSSGTKGDNGYYCQDYFPQLSPGSCHGEACESKDMLCICYPHAEDRDPRARDIESCSQESVHDGVCCKDKRADPGYCRCSHWGCLNNNAGCFCMSTNSPTYSGAECTKKWAHCCANGKPGSGAVSQCECSNEPCGHSWFEVSSCNVGLVSCEKDTVRVPACK